jgi:hypothetical protein
MQTTTKKTTKLTIPHTLEPGVNLVGVLEQLEPDAPTRGRKIALVRYQINFCLHEITPVMTWMNVLMRRFYME